MVFTQLIYTSQKPLNYLKQVNVKTSSEAKTVAKMEAMCLQTKANIKTTSPKIKHILAGGVQKEMKTINSLRVLRVD